MWKGVFAHEWSDETYNLMRRFLQGEPINSKWLVERAKYGYRLYENEIVLNVSKQDLPWILGTTNSNEIFRFRVVKESERMNVLNRYLHNIKDVCLNAHMLLDKIHRDGYLGMSRRFLENALKNIPNYDARNHPRRTVVKAFRPQKTFEHFQADLIDLQKLFHSNRGYRYILVIIDIFSKFVYVFPLKNKTGTDIAQCLNKLFLSGDILKFFTPIKVVNF